MPEACQDNPSGSSLDPNRMPMESPTTGTRAAASSLVPKSALPAHSSDLDDVHEETSIVSAEPTPDIPEDATMIDEGSNGKTRGGKPKKWYNKSHPKPAEAQFPIMRTPWTPPLTSEQVKALIEYLLFLPGATVRGLENQGGPNYVEWDSE